MLNDLSGSIKSKAQPKPGEAPRMPPEKYFIDFWSLANTQRQYTEGKRNETNRTEMNRNVLAEWNWVKFALLVATWESLEGMGNHQDDVLPLFVNLNTQNKQKLPMSRGANSSTCGDKVVRWLMGWCDNRSFFFGRVLEVIYPAA